MGELKSYYLQPKKAISCYFIIMSWKEKKIDYSAYFTKVAKTNKLKFDVIWGQIRQKNNIYWYFLNKY